MQGVLLAAIVHVFVAKKMHAAKVFSGKTNSTLRLALIVAVPVIFHYIGQYLARISGWHIDIPAMFGFDHRIPGGFRIGLYGF